MYNLPIVRPVMGVKHYWRSTWHPILLILALRCIPAAAIDPNQSLNQLYHTEWTARDGLTGAVQGLAQTADGFLWLGTDDGLLRFDGTVFERYKPEVGSLASNSITTLLASTDGGLWVGYQNGGVSFLKNGQIVNYDEHDGLPIGFVRNLAQDLDGTVWAAVLGGLARFDGRRWQIIGKSWNMPSKSPSSIAVDDAGTLWVTSFREGVFFLLRGQRRFQNATSDEIPGPEPDFAQSGDRAMWLWVPQTSSMRHFPPTAERAKSSSSKFANSAGSFLIDRDGCAWMGSEFKGVQRVPHPERLTGTSISKLESGVETYSRKEGLTDNGINCLLEDREGNIWVGTDGGLDRFRARNAVWSRIQPGGYGIALVAGSGGTIWAATPQGIVDALSKKAVPGSPTVIEFAYRDPDGAIWLSSGRDPSKGLWRWQAGKFIRVALPHLSRVEAVARDGTGDLWVSILGFGVFRLHDGAWSQVEILKGEPVITAYAMLGDAKGRIWLAYPERKKIGLWDDGAVRIFSEDDGLRIGAVNALSSSAGQIWAGGDMGVAYFQNGRFHTLEAADGSDFGNITGLIATRDHGLWFSSTTAIVHVARDEIQMAQQRSGHKIRYETFDLMSDLPEPLERSPYTSAAEGTDGVLWFATPSGVARIDPGHLIKNLLPPMVAIRTLVAGGKSYPASGDAFLPPHTRSLHIGYSVLSLSIPQRVHSRYRLEGSDKEWQDGGARGEATYNNLGPGKYTFQVIGSNNDGVWNDTGESLNFTIQPAFYQTAWFQGIYALAIAGLIWLFYRFRLRQVTARVKLRYTERLAERTRIARELHDTLLQSVHGLMFQVQAARNMFHRRPDEALQALDAAIVGTEQAITESQDAIEELRSEPLTQNDLAESLTAAAQELSASQDANPDSPKFHIVVEGERRKLSSVSQEEVYRIAREALRNAFRHAHAHRIEIEIRYDAHELRLRIRDDGEGIDDKVLAQGGRTGHWGLRGIRERAQRMGGQLSLWSEAGAGTEVQLTVPAAVAYEEPSSAARFKFFREGGVP